MIIANKNLPLWLNAVLLWVLLILISAIALSMAESMSTQVFLTNFWDSLMTCSWTIVIGDSILIPTSNSGKIIYLFLTLLNKLFYAFWIAFAIVSFRKK
ncbi:hypothetical protein [Marinoscillum sp.]|uniref:hypothetical protein n=1 Tax=Marinoscillum sp. TaxID=2024838 RepID=UPI003BAB04FF